MPWQHPWARVRPAITAQWTMVGIILFYCVWKMIFEAMATSAVMDVPTDEQELPEHVRLRAKCAVPGEWQKLGRIRHQTT